MTYSVEWTEKARKNLSKLDEKSILKIIQKVEEIKENPRPRLRQLKKIKSWRLRVGDYRVLIDIDETTKKLTVLTLGHRKKIYKI